jgi:hypothetical protein
MKRFREYFQRTLTIPSGSKFIRAAKIKKHRLDTSGDPVLMLTIEVGDETIKYAMHQGLAWQLVRQIRKEIGFSESELDAAQWLGRYSGGNV